MSIITLTTDFGLSDHYVGVMKGVILGLDPEARLVDLCHQVEPYDVLGAALTLAASYCWFPPQTVHLVVVDPGVGSARRAILAQAGSWWFVAPDNGVLELVYRRRPHRVWGLEPEKFALEPISNTFHGRDVFAPAAALIARGTPPEQLGDAIAEYARLPIPQPRESAPGCRLGAVLKVDRFGNLITNFQTADLPTAFLITVGDARIHTLRPSYSAGAPGEIFAIAGSSGFLEVSLNQDSAARALGVTAGAPVELVDTSRRE
ncbi:MAG: SAM-dependent chlorinase/fluorinase [Acidobacteria bacterium]|nr:SAM-dependent chlorinase/fluorinase [Acidobacteriota bacterium]